jgi:hypothetical protein
MIIYIIVMTGKVNIPNSHTFNGASNEGAVVGCQGKGMGTHGQCGVVQYTGYTGGKRKTRKPKRNVTINL